jgi:hypothetical protein
MSNKCHTNAQYISTLFESFFFCILVAGIYATKIVSKGLQFLIQKHHKNQKIVFWPDLASAHYAKDIRSKGRKSTKRPTDTADQNFLSELEKEDREQQLSSKRCKVLDGKDQTRAEDH